MVKEDGHSLRVSDGGVTASSMAPVLALHHSLMDSLGKGEAGRGMTISRL